MSKNDRGLTNTIRKRAKRVSGVHTTPYLHIAMARGYIGEVMLMPKMVSAAVRFMLTNTKMRAAKLYYYGTPDEVTARKFGLG